MFECPICERELGIDGDIHIAKCVGKIQEKCDRMEAERNAALIQIGELRRVLSYFTDGDRGHSISDDGKCCKYHMMIGLDRVWPCPVAEAQELVAEKRKDEKAVPGCPGCNGMNGYHADDCNARSH
jgi:hypothetical protein